MTQRSRLSATMAAVTLVVAACSGDSAESTSTLIDPIGSIDSPASVVAPSTTTPSEPGAVCAVLEAAPFERRKATVANLDDAEAIAGRCRDALATTEAAVLVDTAARSLADKNIADLDSQLECSGEGFAWTVTNSFDLAIGLYGIAELYRLDDGEEVDRLGSSATPVIWRLEPGATAVLDGVFPSHTADLDRCSIAGWFFVADGDDLPGDAAVAVGGGDVGDEPDVWLPIIYQRQRMYVVTGEAELVETFEDLRSLGYARLVAEADSGATVPATQTAPTVEVCGTVAEGEEGAVGLVYQVEPDEGLDREAAPYLVFGVFRRGADHMWRWLGSSVRWTADNLTTCRDWRLAVDG